MLWPRNSIPTLISLTNSCTTPRRHRSKDVHFNFIYSVMSGVKGNLSIEYSTESGNTCVIGGGYSPQRMLWLKVVDYINTC